jgi:hypothetical protein
MLRSLSLLLYFVCAFVSAGAWLMTSLPFLLLVLLLDADASPLSGAAAARWLEIESTTHVALVARGSARPQQATSNTQQNHSRV